MSQHRPGSPEDADASFPVAPGAEFSDSAIADGTGKSARLTRRDLLSGRLWKVLRLWGKGATARMTGGGPRPPLLRYPRTLGDVQAAQGQAVQAPAEQALASGDGPTYRRPAPTAPAVASIQGILIAPVLVRGSESQRTAGLDAITQSSGGPQASHTATRPLTIPLVRPPGAIEESQFLAGCTRCGDCAQACPHNAIFSLGSSAAGSRGNRAGGVSAAVAVKRLPHLAGTPILDADVQACLMCEGFPCISACSPGVLSAQIPKAMATARITQQLCLAHQGSSCTACSDQCPRADAIRIRGAMPVVDEAACTGCGICRQVCPAAENAILLMPTFVRPPLPNAAVTAPVPSAGATASEETR